MFQFANTYYLYALVIIPILIFLYILLSINRKKAIEKFGELSIISRLMPLASKKRHFFKFLLQLLSLTLLIFALARPQYGIKLREVKTEGVEIIIALDVSNSMLAVDKGSNSNRLDMAKMAITRLLDNLKDDKIGLIVFAGTAFMQVPVTTDYTATKMMLSSINPGLIQDQGTAIGDAIDLATKSFDPKNQKKKALIIITDGENHIDNPVDEAEKAEEIGINTYTIGIGDPSGTPIPIPGSSDFRKDQNGEVIITKLDEDMLMKIAQAGKGNYTRANSAKFGLMNIYNDIEKLDKTELASTKFSEYEDVYQYIVLLALLLLLGDFAIMNRKNKQLEKFKLFNLRN
jgi:Ca-activated chloride channel homolog